MQIQGHGSGDQQIRVVEADEGEQINVLIARYAREGEQIVAVSVEDADEDLELDVIIREKLRHRHHVHFHRRHEPIKVIVTYAGLTDIERPFRANKRFETVRQWAVGPEGFKFDPVDAAELVLAFNTPPERVNLDLHVGDLPHPDHVLHLSLVPKSFFQG